MKLKLLNSARRDLREITLHMDRRSAANGIAEAFVREIVRHCARLADLSGTLGTDRSDLRPGFRSKPHGNYLILFRYIAEAVEIVNVFHASRDVTTHYDED